MELTEKEHYIMLPLTFNEAIYLSQVLKESNTIYPSLVKWPLQTPSLFVGDSLQELLDYEKFGTSPFDHDVCRDLLLSISATLNVRLCDFLDYNPERPRDGPDVFPDDEEIL